MKIKDIPYYRVSEEETEKVCKECINAVKNAKTVDEVLKARDVMIKALQKFGTMSTVAYIKFTLDASDEFFVKEREYYEMESPKLTEISNEFGKAILNSPLIEEIKKHI